MSMPPKRNRLTRAQFATFFASGKRFHTPLFTLIYAPSPTFHAAVVVGKKVSKKAVVRNRLRRRIYAALYALWRARGCTGVYIILTKPAAHTASTADIRATLTDRLEKIGKSR